MDNRRSSVRSCSPLVEGESSRSSAAEFTLLDAVLAELARRSMPDEYAEWFIDNLPREMLGDPAPPPDFLAELFDRTYADQTGAEPAVEPTEARVATLALSNDGAMARARAAAAAERSGETATDDAATYAGEYTPPRPPPRQASSAAPAASEAWSVGRPVIVVAGTPVVPGDPMPDVEAGNVAGGVQGQIKQQLIGRRYRLVILGLCLLVTGMTIAVGAQAMQLMVLRTPSPPPPPLPSPPPPPPSPTPPPPPPSPSPPPPPSPSPPPPRWHPPSSPSGTVQQTDGTFIDVTFELCSVGPSCTAQAAKSACTSTGKKVVSHASDGTSEVYSLGATSSCHFSISYFTVDVDMDPTECLVGISNLEWSSCCGTTRWHGYTTPFGPAGDVFGGVSSVSSGYNSNYLNLVNYPSNLNGVRWGCNGEGLSNGLNSCSGYYVACH